MTDRDKLAELAIITAAMHHGRAAFEQRLGELASGYPSKGDGGSGASEEGGPTVSQVVRMLDPCERCEEEGKRCTHGTDPADKIRRDWNRDLTKALDAAVVCWEQYKRIANPRPGAPRLTDPGCELCAKVPCGCQRCAAIDGRHWCAKFAAVEHEEPPKRKGLKPTRRPMVLCASCYEFQRADRAGRLPTHDEVLDHVEGRRRRWKQRAS